MVHLHQTLHLSAIVAVTLSRKGPHNFLLGILFYLPSYTGTSGGTGSQICGPLKTWDPVYLAHSSL